MTISKVSTFVTTAWLRQQIHNTARNAESISNSLRILDTSWSPNPKVDGYKEFYQQGHIPTAVYFDINKVSPAVKASDIKYPLPDSNVFQDYVEDLGISNHTHVVAYDGLNSLSSLRTWFLFRVFGHSQVSVLNGGLRQWISDGNHVTTDHTEVEPGEFDVKFQPKLLRDHSFLMKNTDTAAEQVLDAREPDLYQSGHIPEAKNIPYTSLFDENGMMQDVSELKQLFDRAGVDLSGPIISSCQSGLKACGVIAAAHILGKEDVSLYNGSFMEWSALAAPDMIRSPPSGENDQGQNFDKLKRQ